MSTINKICVSSSINLLICNSTSVVLFRDTDFFCVLSDAPSFWFKDSYFSRGTKIDLFYALARELWLSFSLSCASYNGAASPCRSLAFSPRGWMLFKYTRMYTSSRAGVRELCSPFLHDIPSHRNKSSYYRHRVQGV